MVCVFLSVPKDLPYEWLPASYKPILEEVERILAEAGLDEEEMRRTAAAGGPAASDSGISRNRR